MKWILLFGTACLWFTQLSHAATYVRYQAGGDVQYGERRGEALYPISGDIFSSFEVSTNSVPIDDVELLLPTQPEKVFAVGMNFASHLASRSSAPPPIFLKLPSSLALSGQSLAMPSDATNVHFEGELVLVIGKTVSKANESEASAAIFGVTAGNDLTERNWQGSDLQWVRAKASDGFGPISPEIITGIDHTDVVITTKLNGTTVQQESTRNMIHSASKVVSYLSQYYTLKPGDLIFMGTPGRTKALSNGDVVDVSIGDYTQVSNQISF
ncbi:fumarylacetoacetate hydrolase [Vibrio sp. qd031]|uniref:fumarylacetoacetate hydrolase family protein n=1 Tax=Vibrio sp. qd031 TaxID=1603038 RepID=UPI000A116A44|nr:fumarylacetoacetate hydrolase family protein [Vibrio sp. qd031]ORT48761.1 fumarylacetoacetate hydrolase [Vibrio sp. qd031]